MSTERVEVAESFLTRREVAERLKVSTRTVDRYIADGDLVASKPGGGRLVRIAESDFIKFASSERVA